MANFISNFFIKIYNNFNVLKNINFLKKKKIKFIFYSENKSYQKYALLLIKTLANKYPGEVYYVSSDLNDKINDPNIKSFYIGSGLLRQFFFLLIQSENIFLTITDLDNHSLKKTKNIKNYIYYFHSPVSTTKVYTNSAFDNYDTILCNGNYQIQEIQQRETLKNLPKKKLIKNGYFYFDQLINNIDLDKKLDEILIAPSWSYNEEYFINENFINIVNTLLKKKFKVRFRPHQEHFKRSKIILDEIKKNMINKNFIYDISSKNMNAMENAKCLITDNSGIAIEYTLILKRPVLYFDDKEKLHNLELNDYKNLINLEDNVKNTFGYSFKKNDIEKIDLLINKLIINFSSRKPEIDNFLNNNFFNNNNISNFFTNNMNDILVKSVVNKFKN